MTSADIKELAPTIQALALTVAVLVGGVWTLMRYVLHRDARRARADLEKLNMELQRTGVLQIVTTISELADTKKGLNYFKAALNIVNVGRRTEVVDMRKSYLRAGLLDGIRDNRPHFLEIQDYQFYGIRGPIDSFSINPAQSLLLEILIPFDQCGIYGFMVVLEPSPEQIEDEHKEFQRLAGLNPKGRPKWSQIIYANTSQSDRLPRGDA